MSRLLANELQLGDNAIHGAGTIGKVTTIFDLDISGADEFSAYFVEQLSNIIGFLTLLGALFFLMYFFIAAFDWLRAGDDKGSVDKAKGRMTNAAIGLFIIVLAIGIIGIVGGVLGIDILNPQEIFLEIIPLS